MISSDKCFSEKVADYLNSHPAFKNTDGFIMNSDFYYKYILEFVDIHPGTMPIADKYRKGIFGQEMFTLDDAKKFLEWIDPKWMDFKHLSKSEFFNVSNLKLTDDIIEFMDI